MERNMKHFKCEDKRTTQHDGVDAIASEALYFIYLEIPLYYLDLYTTNKCLRCLSLALVHAGEAELGLLVFVLMDCRRTPTPRTQVLTLWLGFQLILSPPLFNVAFNPPKMRTTQPSVILSL
jgi:hypothetical protein